MFCSFRPGFAVVIAYFASTTSFFATSEIESSFAATNRLWNDKKNQIFASAELVANWQLQNRSGTLKRHACFFSSCKKEGLFRLQRLFRRKYSLPVRLCLRPQGLQWSEINCGDPGTLAVRRQMRWMINCFVNVDFVATKLPPKLAKAKWFLRVTHLQLKTCAF